MKYKERELEAGLLEVVNCVRTVDALKLTYESLRKEWIHQFDDSCIITCVSPRDCREYHIGNGSLLSAILQMYLDIKTGKIN